MKQESLLAGYKLHSLLALAETVREINGDIAEIGVYRGHTIKTLSSLFQEKTCYAFDTFFGIPQSKHSPIDGHGVGDFSVEEDVDSIISDLLCRKNINVIKGVFPESAHGINASFCFSHVDADTYTTTLESLHWLWPRTTVGGIIVVDDYMWKFCNGVEKAMSEFISVLGDVRCGPYESKAIKYQAYLIKQ